MLGMEGRRNKKREKDRKEEGIHEERRKEKRKKNGVLLSLNWSGEFCWSSCL